MASSNSSSKLSPTFDDLQEDDIRVLYLDPGNLEDPLTGELKRASIIPCTNTRSTVPSQRRLSSESEDGESGCDEPGDSESGGYDPGDSDARYRAAFPPTPHASVAYEAISYAWESSDKPCSIQIRNIGPIAITKSLFDILRHLRCVNRCRVLWADAICIDQRNVSERNHQVAKMADIFSASTTVLVWLGAGGETDSLAFATIEICNRMRTTNSKDGSGRKTAKEYGKDAGNHTIDLQALRHALCEYTGPHASFGRSIGSQEDVAITALQSIFTIFQAKWFERMWVVQETNGVRDVVYFRGYHGISREDLGRAFGLLADHVREIRPHDSRIDLLALTEMVEHISSRYAPSHGGGLTWHFLRYSARRCYDPKDRVYALRQNLGLESYDELRPDYELDYVEVFRRFVCVCLNLENRQLNVGKAIIHPALILALVGTEQEPRSNPDSPSWVPCLHELTNASRAKVRLYSKACLMNVHRGEASFDDHWLDHGTLLTARVMPESPKLFHFRGRCFAEASEPCSLQDLPDVGPQYSYGDTTTRDHVEAAASWIAACCCRVADCVPGALDMGLEYNLVNFALYPAMWNFPYRLDRKHFGDDFRELLEFLVSRGTGGRMSLDSSLCNHVLDLALLLPTCPLAKKRKLWRVQLEGQTDAAWVPDKTQIGDKICVMPGAPWPFVVREFDDNSYTLIGDAQLYSTSLMQALGSERQESEYAFNFGAPLGFNTDIQPSDADMAKVSWITLR
jgi:hypothetical protein